MKRHPLRWIVLLLVAAAAGVVIWHLNRPQPTAVNLRPVERGTVERTVANTRAGTVKACRRAKLSPSVGGQIAQLPIREGDAVKAGQLLLELWNADLVAEVDFARKGARRRPKARAKAACLNADVAQREADRLLKLRHTGAASEDRTDKAVTEAKALRAECSATRSSVERSQARIGVVRANLSRTRLVAPFDGVVAEINGELSEFVTPSPIGIPTPPAVDLIDNSCFTSPHHRRGGCARHLRRPNRPGHPGCLRQPPFRRQRPPHGRFRPGPRKAGRTVNVEVQFTPTEDIRQLLAGYSADVEIILEARQETLRIPTEAVLDGARVFVYLPGPANIRAKDD